MKIKNIIYSLLFLVSSNGLFAQEVMDSVKKEITPKLSVLDSLKRTFVKHDEMSCIDSQWMKELSNQELSDEQFQDIANINIDQTVDYDLPTSVLKERLKKLDAKSPFNIEYNQGLENVIKSLLKNRKKTYERLLAISQYYFPMFEDALAKYNIPLEIKYLAIVESALNPKAKSRVGATGLWQFMYGTGIQYNLDVNSYVDERSDPLKATEAACKYLSGMYALFGDWDLVLASYNCGPGNVTKAIRRSGGQKNYWNIRKNLPKETAGYLPAFLATMYIMEYHKEHGINAQKAPVTYFATDTIQIKHELSFKQISSLLDIPVSELQFLNPAYKMDVIPHVASKINYLRLPQEKVAVFASNEDKIYYYANYEENLREKPYISKDTLSDGSPKRYATRYKFHKVRRGENLNEIASKYGVSENDVRKWNKLRGNRLPLGRNLKIVTTERVTPKEIVVKVEKSKEIIQHKKDSTSNAIASVVEIPKVKESITYKDEKVVTYKEVTKIHKVKKGENLSTIADKYDVSMSEIKKWNKLKSNAVVRGKNLKIITNEKVVTTVRKKDKKPTIVKQEVVADNNENAVKQPEKKPAKETFTIKEEKVVSYKDVTKSYKVKKGDNLSTIADKFDVTVAEIKKWNKLKSNNVALGKNLKITTNEKVVTTIKKKIKKETPQKEAIAIIETKDKPAKKIDTTTEKTTQKSLVQAYVVEKGDNLYTISKRYNISLSQLKEWNNIENDNVQLGTKLIVSKPDSEIGTEKEEPKIKEYIVAKGDNVWSISKKFGVTLAQLKEWNNLPDNSIQQGSKLIVSKTEAAISNEQKVSNDKKLKNEIAEKKRYEKLYYVKKGDSLFSISQKYPGVTVSDLKKWNDIRNGNIKPGMKLKISG